ncbi:MAG: lamin tail domain-containing protein [bacterium]
MKNKTLVLFGLGFFLAACSGPKSGNFQSLLSTQPYVIDLSPTPYKVLKPGEKIEIEFSRPVEKPAEGSPAVMVIQGEVDPEAYKDASDLVDDVKKDNLKKVEGTLSAESAEKITWAPTSPLPEGSVTLVVTPALEGKDKIPFNQQPGEAPTLFFATYYTTPNGGGENASDPAAAPGTPQGSGGSKPPMPSKPRPDSLVLNEILYDASGSDTDGNEFIELYGTPNTYLDGYQVVLLNGADGAILKAITLPEGSKIPEDGLFVVADARTNQSAQSNIPHANYIDNFDPQNGPDSVQLLDTQGKLLDAVAYGTGGVELGKNGLAAGEGLPAVDVIAGHSISRVNGKDTDDNHGDFIDLETPTPGIL